MQLTQREQPATRASKGLGGVGGRKHSGPWERMRAYYYHLPTNQTVQQGDDEDDDSTPGVIGPLGPLSFDDAFLPDLESAV